MAKQFVLDGDHVRQQKAVGVTRPRRSNGYVVDDRARAHGDDPIRKRQGLIDIVGDEQHVQEQHFTAIRKDSRDSDSLQHSAGKLARPGLFDMRKTDPAQIIARDLPTFAGRNATALEAILNIVDDAQPRKHAIALKNHSALAAGSGDLLAINDNRAGGWRVEARDHLQERALSTAGWADQTDELAFRHDERHVVNGIDTLSVRTRVGSPDANELDHATVAIGRHLARLLNGRQNSMRRIAR